MFSKINLSKYDKLTMQDPDTGEIITFSKMAEKVEKLAEAQMEKIVMSAEKKYSLADNKEVADAYQEEKKEKVNFIVEAITAQAAAGLLKNLIESGYEEFNTKIIGASPKQQGGYFGEYIETDWFGMKVDIKQTEDIDAIQTEIKSHGVGKSQKPGNVGRITMTGDSEFDARGDQALRNLVIMAKMATKMENLLLIKIEPETTSSGTVRATYPEINLFMTLILKKLYDMLKAGIAMGVTVDVGKWNEKNKSVLFGVRMDMRRIEDTYRFVELYLYNLDLLQDIKSDTGFRNNFFGLMRHVMNLRPMNGKMDFSVFYDLE